MKLGPCFEAFTHITTSVPRNISYNPHCTDEQTEAQRSEGIWQGWEQRSSQERDVPLYPRSKFLEGSLGSRCRAQRDQEVAQGCTHRHGWLRLIGVLSASYPGPQGGQTHPVEPGWCVGHEGGRNLLLFSFLNNACTGLRMS